MARYWSPLKALRQFLSGLSQGASIITPARLLLGYQNRYIAKHFLQHAGCFYQPIDIEFQSFWRIPIQMRLPVSGFVDEISASIDGLIINAGKQSPALGKRCLKTVASSGFSLNYCCAPCCLTREAF